jgi:hypothetical protein
MNVDAAFFSIAALAAACGKCNIHRGGFVSFSFISSFEKFFGKHPANT